MNQQKFITLFILMTLAMLSCDLVTYRNDPNLEDNTSRYVVNFRDHLGKGWIWKAPVHSREDIQGFSSSIVDSTRTSTAHKDHENAFIAHYITKLKDEDSAEKRFQKNRDFVRRIFNRIFEIELPLSESTSDQHFAACNYALNNSRVQDLQCIGVFRFESYVVFVNTRAVVEGVRYLADEEIIEVFNLAVEAMEQE